MEHWTTEKDNAGIVWLRLDKADSSANVLSAAVMTELNELADELHASPPRGVVVCSGKKNGFVMGADINEFTSVDSAERAYEVTRQGQQVFAKLESLACPTVAVINGFALGGGLELALACDIIVAADHAELGLPEPRRGLIAGGVGVHRLPRQIGLKTAMGYLLTGRHMTAQRAYELGLVNEVVPAAQLDACVDGWVEDILRCAPLAVNVQLKTKLRRKEKADLARFAEILRKNSYQGYVALEYEEENPRENIPRILGELTALFRTDR